MEEGKEEEGRSRDKEEGRGKGGFGGVATDVTDGEAWRRSQERDAGIRAEDCTKPTRPKPSEAALNLCQSLLWAIVCVCAYILATFFRVAAVKTERKDTLRKGRVCVCVCACAGCRGGFAAHRQDDSSHTRRRTPFCFYF